MNRELSSSSESDFDIKDSLEPMNKIKTNENTESKLVRGRPISANLKKLTKNRGTQTEYESDDVLFKKIMILVYTRHHSNLKHVEITQDLENYA